MLSDTTQESSVTLKDAQTTESNEIKESRESRSGGKILVLTACGTTTGISIINFPLPSYASAGSNGDLTQYFVTLPPDLTTMTAIMDALQTLPLPPPSVIKQLSSQAASEPAIDNKFRPMREYPTVSFYDLESLLKPTSNEASSSDSERAEMLSHKTEGTYLVAEDADGVEELGEDDTETWLDETQSIQDVEQDTCFEMEHDIDLRAAVVTRVIEQGRPVPEKEVEEASESTVDDGAEDLDGAWDW
ncbi:hypothetical protein EV363DRAFT_1456072 [Boletus edulis]|nr:hypothetical protein EV363DRAFT_1456072 [Boletus edulis]